MSPDTDPPGQPGPPFRIDVHPERDAVRVVPVGELDLATASLLEEQLHELRSAGFDHVVLDLRDLAFIDSSGIRVIVAEHRFAETTEHEFSLRSGPPPVQRALEMCGLLGVLQVDAG